MSPDTEGTLEFSLRSTAGLFGYLEEIARNQLGLGGRTVVEPEIFFRKTADSGEIEIDTLFKIQRGAGSDSSLGVSYRGHTFGITIDPTNHDHSSTALELVETLVALNSSAKDAPSPNVITLVGGR